MSYSRRQTTGRTYAARLHMGSLDMRLLALETAVHLPGHGRN